MDTSEDVVFCVLLWLPVSTLLRFKTVCKSWRSLIESSDFATKHLHHNHQDHDSWDLITVDVKGYQPPVPSCSNKDCSDEYFDDVYFTFLSGNNFQFFRISGFNFRFQNSGGFHHGEIITSCDGIIFVELGHSYNKMVDDRYNPDIALWNPATRQFRTLPHAPVGIPKNVDYGSCIYYSFLTYGLGFDVKTNDYKVVRILIDDLRPYDYTTPFKSRTDVYSLNTNSWKTVDAGVLPVRSVWQNPHVPFRSGIYCWLGTYQYDHSHTCPFKNLIFSFDFGSEEFGSIPLPDFFVGDSRPDLILSFLKENIACLVRPYPYPNGDPTTEIWVLKQYGVADSWSKLYTLALENLCRPFGISKNGKIFWGKFPPKDNPLETTVNLSDPVTHESNILPLGYHTHRLQVAHYKESLVLIKSAIGASAVENDKHVKLLAMGSSEVAANFQQCLKAGSSRLHKNINS